MDSDKSQAVLQAAQALFDTNPQSDWVTFYREIMGVDGAIRKVFSDPSEVQQFYETANYTAIQTMLGRLRTVQLDRLATKVEPTQEITPRIPKSLHAALKDEVAELRAKGHQGMSMNKLVIVKCLAPTRPELLPPIQ
jgi:hypothetical protein